MSLVGLRLGKYQVVKQIGGGGMSEIYLANDTALRRQVAIKVIRTEIAPYPDSETTRNAARLFEREAHVISMLDHPHILPLYDFGEATVEGLTLAYLVMPYRPDGSLTNWMRNRGTTALLQPYEVQHFINQAAEALYYAHQKQIVHRDVKLSNFLIQGSTSNQNLPYIQLADFGIAKISAGTSGMSQSVSGTATYMPPEQWNGHPVFASDQYALAVMTYELLTGRLPFEGDLVRLMQQHYYTPPQLPSALNPRLSPAIDAVLLRAMDKVPEKRFPTILDFARAFSQAVQNRPVQNVSLPPPPPNNSGYIASPGPSFQSTGAVDPNKTTYPNIIPAASGSGNPNRPTYLSGAFPPTQGPGPFIPGQQPDVSQKPRSASLSRILILVTVILIIILGGVAFGGYTIINNAHVAATATATTNNANATATARVAITATAHAQATTTAIAQATAHAQAANPEPNAYTPPNGTLALLDPLNGSSVDREWDSGSGCTFRDGGYHATETKANTFTECFLANPLFGNFALQVDLVNTSGDCGGIAFRANSGSGQDYVFSVCQNNLRYYLYRCDGFNKTCQELANRLAPIEINGGLNQTNTMAVVANGHSFSLYINQIFVTSATDDTFTTGSIGLISSEINDPTEAVYNNLKVWIF